MNLPIDTDELLQQINVNLYLAINRAYELIKLIRTIRICEFEIERDAAVERASTTIHTIYTSLDGIGLTSESRASAIGGPQVTGAI